MRRKGSSHSSEELTPTVQQVVDELIAALTQGGQAVLTAETTLEGVLAAVGVGYLAHAHPTRLRLAPQGQVQLQLGETCVAMPPTDDRGVVRLAARVHAAFARACGEACATRLALAAACDDPALPQVAHEYLRLGFSVRRQLYGRVTDPRCTRLNSLARRTLSECEKTRQFVRFSRLSDGSWASTFEPRANTLPLTAQHFARRMQAERFCIVDPIHHVAAFHHTGEATTSLLHLDDTLTRTLLMRQRDLANEEPLIRNLWRGFYRAMELPGRGASQRGYDLRASWMPKRLWKNLTELVPELTSRGPERYREA